MELREVLDPIMVFLIKYREVLTVAATIAIPIVLVWIGTRVLRGLNQLGDHVVEVRNLLTRAEAIRCGRPNADWNEWRDV